MIELLNSKLANYRERKNLTQLSQQLIVFYISLHETDDFFLSREMRQ